MAFRDRRVTLKSASQIARMAVAGKLVADVLETVGAAVRPGVTTLELDRIAEEMIRAAGGIPSFLGVPGHLEPYRHSLCISIDSEVVHGVPGKRRIAEGQIVSIDAGAIVDGWHGDGARTYIVGEVPAATRQLASRARRRVQSEAPDPDADLVVQRRVVDAFLAAARAGDFEGLVRILDPDVVFHLDGGGHGPLARPPIAGAERVAREVKRFGPRFASYARPAIVNGAAGIVVPDAPGQPPIVMGFTIRAGRIAELDLNGDPAKTAKAIRDLG